MTGKEAQLALEGANLTLNRNTVPGETRSPFQTSGLGLVLQRLPQEECWKRRWNHSKHHSYNSPKSKRQWKHSSSEREVACPLLGICITLLVIAL